jgi:small-conductance mechanosensitive channel
VNIHKTQSLFSVGATGTLIFGLASKDLASQLLAGLTLHLSEKMFEGDSVRFSDSTSGTIAKMGWFETMIQNSDDVVVGVPNSQLTGQRVYNLSRTPNSQVKQTLRTVMRMLRRSHCYWNQSKTRFRMIVTS